MFSGQLRCASPTTCLTRLTVSMMFSPDRFLTSSEIAGFPSSRAKVWRSLKVRRTDVTSRTVTTLSPLTLSGMLRMSFTFSNSPGTFTAKLPRSDRSLPAAISLFDRLIESRISLGSSAYESSRSGSMISSTCSSRSPPILTSRTLDRPSSVSCRSRASLSSVRSGTSPPSVTTRTGNSPKFTSFTRGSSASSGSSVLAMSTFSRTSWRALSASNPASNSSSTFAPPWKAVDRISFTLSTDFSSVSMGRTSRRSASSGEMPSSVIET